MNRIIYGICNDIRKNCYTHLVSTISAFILGLIFLFIGYTIVNSVVISGHEYRTSVIFRNVEISSDTLISEPVEIGVGGGYASISLKIESSNDNVPITIKYQLSFDNKTWLSHLDQNYNIILNREIETSKWYIETLSFNPAAYIRFTVGINGDNLSYEPVIIDMELFAVM